MLIPIEVVSFAVDTNLNSPLIILKESNGVRTLAIPIGPLEAGAIAVQSLNVPMEKPLTIDLVKLVMERLGGRLSRMVIYDFVNRCFLAHIQIVSEKSIITVECRPCDALGLALRSKAPIFAEDQVFAKSAGSESLSEPEKLRRSIAQLDTTEFGRYYLE